MSPCAGSSALWQMCSSVWPSLNQREAALEKQGPHVTQTFNTAWINTCSSVRKDNGYVSEIKIVHFASNSDIFCRCITLLLVKKIIWALIFCSQQGWKRITRLRKHSCHNIAQVCYEWVNMTPSIKYIWAIQVSHVFPERRGSLHSW